MKKARALLLAALLVGALPAIASEAKGIPAPDALTRLERGNARAAAGRPRHPNISSARRLEVAKGQHPFAVVVSCSDSRVPPEVVFDQGIGDLFVVRTAGNVVDDVALGSIEYAVEHLGPSLIVVLGHERCGAVTAAIGGGEAPGHVAKIVEAIRPAVESTANVEGDRVDAAARENVRRVAEAIESDAPVAERHATVVGMLYDLDTGRVEKLAR